jgi:phosphatidylinositol alpha-mannosyltransferase
MDLMRIAQLLPYDPEFQGGVKEHVLHLSRALERRGQRVTIFAPGSRASTRSDCLDFPRVVQIVTEPLVVPANGSIARVIGPDFEAWGTLIDTLNGGQFDVVHLHEPMLWLPLLVSRTGEARLIATFHAAGNLGEIGEIARNVVGRLREEFDATIAVSAAARAFANSYGLEPDQVIPNGVDVSVFGAHRDRTGPTVLFFSRLDERKGLETLMRAMPAVAHSAPGVRLVVAGNFSVDEPRAQHFSGLARELALDCDFVPSPTDAEKVRLFESATLLCAPAYGQESFGIVLAEALAAGLPIVASDLWGFREVLDDGQLALLVQPRNELALADAISQMLSDPSLRRRLSQTGREKARTLAWPVVAARILDVYDAARRRPARSNRGRRALAA